MFTINTRFTSFLYLPITMISMITRSDMQRERARERIDRARRQWELEHGKLDQPLPFHLDGIITIKSRWQLLAFPAGSNIPERKPYFNQTMTNVGELEAVVENEKGRKSAAGSSQMMPPYDAAVLTMVRSTFISTIIIHMIILLISAKRDNLNESSASRICSIELSAEHQLPSSYSLQSASGLQYFDISNGIEIAS